jgi:hypothetical protein
MRQAPPYRAAALTALGVFILYVLTLAPTTQFWDASEYLTAAHALGIPHAPGSPLFVLLAHVWGLLPLAGDYGARINVLAACTSALSAGLWFLITDRWLEPIVAGPIPRRLVAFAGTLVGATAFTVWNQSVVNEKVYTISLLTITLTLWLALQWAGQPRAQRDDRLLVLIAYLLALTSANHQMGLLSAGAVFVLICVTEVQVLWRPRFLIACGGAVALAATVYLFLPIRSPLDPYLNQGVPSTWQAFWDVINRTQFGKPPLTMRQADMGNQMLMWLQYFGWQWGKDLSNGVAAALAVGFGSLGLLGARRHWVADKRQALVMTTLMVTLTLALVFYLNFKYGFSQLPGQAVEREVRERDYFFLCSFSAWGVWVAMGLATLIEWAGDALETRVVAPSRRFALASPVLLLALVPLITNRQSASRRGETMARDLGADMLQSVDPYGILVTGGDNDTFPLWYAQEVGGVRRDVTVLVTSLGNLNWYLQQMEQRPVPRFDSAAAPALYHDRAWPAPAGPWFRQLYRTPVDSLPQFIAVPRTVTGKLGPLQITIDPDRLPPEQRGYLSRVDLALMQLIKENIGRRPIFFSTTVGDYPERLGLGPYLVTEGMVRRLMPAPVTPSDRIRLSMVQGRYVDIPRTTRLAFEVYHGAAAARPRPKGWVDRASQNSLLPYIMTYDTIAEALQQSDPRLAAQAMQIATATLANTTYQFDLAPPAPAPPPARR